MEPRHAYAQMSAALNRTGRPMHLNMCEWGLQKPWEWGGKVAQSWRMSQDHVGRWNHTHIGPKFVDNLGTMQVRGDASFHHPPIPTGAIIHVARCHVAPCR